MADQPEQQLQFTFEPGDHETGVYANIVSVWHTPWDFTLDFALAGNITRNEGDTTTVRAPIVARVKLPTSVIFQLARAIADNVDIYERQYGPINQQ